MNILLKYTTKYPALSTRNTKALLIYSFQGLEFLLYTFFFFLKLFGWQYYIPKRKDKFGMLVYCLKSSRHSTVSSKGVRCSEVSQSVALVKEVLRVRPTPGIPGLREIKMLPTTLPSWRCHKCLCVPRGEEGLSNENLSFMYLLWSIFNKFLIKWVN